MFVCHDVRTEVWQPDFSSSEQASPTWTRVLCRGMQLTNSLEWVAWTENPVQIVLCTACGEPGCASGGYVHVSRLADFVLFSSAQVDEEHSLPYQVYETPHILRTLGALAIRVATWNGWTSVPPADGLVRANHAAIEDAWITGPARSPETITTHLRERLVGGDTLEKERAIDLVERVLAATRPRREEPFLQPLLAPGDVGARLEKLYFDGASELDWLAFAFAGDDVYIALDEQHIAAVEI